MRMDNINTKLTAETIINEYDEKELSDIFLLWRGEKFKKNSKFNC